MSITGAVPRRWTILDFQKMTATGLIGDNERVELIDGEVVRLLPRQREHSDVASRLANRLSRTLPPDYIVRYQRPLDISTRSQPVPDFAVVDRLMLEEVPHPRCPYLVIEVPSSCLRYYREVKPCLYASARIPELWVVHLGASPGVEVFADPRPSDGPFGAAYSSVAFVSGLDKILRPAFDPALVFSLRDWFVEGRV